MFWSAGGERRGRTGKETDTRDLDDLEANTRDVTAARVESQSSGPLTASHGRQTHPLALPLRPNPETRTSVGSAADEYWGAPFSRQRGERTVVLVDKVEATVVRDEGGDLLAVLDELDTDTLADGRVGLLRLDTDLFEDDALGVRGTAGRGRAVRGAERALLVVGVGPTVVAAVVTELAAGEQTTRLAGSC